MVTFGNKPLLFLHNQHIMAYRVFIHSSHITVRVEMSFVGAYRYEELHYTKCVEVKWQKFNQPTQSIVTPWQIRVSYKISSIMKRTIKPPHDTWSFIVVWQLYFRYHMYHIMCISWKYYLYIHLAVLFWNFTQPLLWHNFTIRCTVKWLWSEMIISRIPRFWPQPFPSNFTVTTKLKWTSLPPSLGMIVTERNLYMRINSYWDWTFTVKLI